MAVTLCQNLKLNGFSNLNDLTHFLAKLIAIFILKQVFENFTKLQTFSIRIELMKTIVVEI